MLSVGMKSFIMFDIFHQWHACCCCLTLLESDIKIFLICIIWKKCVKFFYDVYVKGGREYVGEING